MLCQRMLMMRVGTIVANPAPTTYSVAMSPIRGGRLGPWQMSAAVPNGGWTWFSDPRAVYRNGAVYIGWVNSSGTSGISKHVIATGVTTSFNLSSVGLQTDDHNNTAIQFLSDGRIMAIYGRHNDSAGMRYRISTNAEDISAWSPEVVLPVTLPYTYSNPHFLSTTGKIYCHYRSGEGGWGTNPMKVRAFDGSTWDTEREWIVQTGERPYIKACNNGVDRIDFLLTNCHPNEGASSIYHCYMQLDSGVEKFYRSDGTLISNGPVTPAECTLLYDGTAVDAWVWEIAYGSDGHPRAVFARFPTTTDHRYMFSRWTGSEWTAPTEITTGGTYLYSGEVNYSGGIAFEENNPNVVYLSKQVGSAWEVQEWATQDSGATWAKVCDVTAGSGSGIKNCRPYSPKGHPWNRATLFWSGTYTTYTNYHTAIKLYRR